MYNYSKKVRYIAEKRYVKKQICSRNKKRYGGQPYLFWKELFDYIRKKL